MGGRAGLAALANSLAPPATIASKGDENVEASSDNPLMPHHAPPDVRRAVLSVLEDSLSCSGDFGCPYLPGRVARSEGFHVDSLAGEWYRWLLDRGFRRSGHVIYRPVCRGCGECRQIRVPTAEFQPTRSQRRVRRRNVDVQVSSGAPQLDEERWRLYCAYLNARHDGSMSRTRAAFVDFLYGSCIETQEVCYRLDGRLVGVSILDVVPDAWSSVYMFYDPTEQRRSLGTYSVLWEIEECRRRGIAYYYLGYYVAGSPTMAYKARFAPHEL
ncbi:MAG TPA: arginyltransferase, partial [Phycisphaerae bacterium]